MKKEFGSLQIAVKRSEVRPSFLGGAVLLLGLSIFLCRIFPSVGVQWWQLCGLCALLYAALCLAEWFGKGAWGGFAALVLTAAVCVLFRQRFSGGIASLANDMTETLTRVTGRIHLQLSLGEGLSALWGLLPLAVVITVIIFFAARVRRVLYLLPLPLAVLGGTVFGLFEPQADLALIGAGALLLLVRRGHGETTKIDIRSLFPPILLTICAALLALALASIFPTDGRFADRLSDRLHELRYDESTNSMPEGKLRDLTQWEKSDTPALKITMTVPQKVYLRGCIYDTYTGSEWLPADTRETADYADLFYTLHKSDFYGQSQIALAASRFGEENAETMTIENLSACAAHGYYPYAALGSFDAAVIGDTDLPETDTLQYFSGSVPQWYALQNAVAEAQDDDYLSAENAYSAYVRETDLDLTDEATTVLRRLLGDEPKTLAEIRTLIVNVLGETLEYDEGAVTNCGETDFLQYTLEGSKSGYSVHYATAAVLMLRYLGVPARYVEGYYLSADDAAAYEAGEEIILTEENAHAWAEYYLAGVGFVPFEVTPPYIDDEEWSLGADASQEREYYDRLHEAQVETPEEIKEPHTANADFSLKVLYLLPILLFLWLIFELLRRRTKFRRALAAIDAAPNREAIALRYGYALRLLESCGEPSDDTSHAAVLNREALFSDHAMTQEQRREMDSYAADALVLCRKKWNFVQKLRYRFVDCLY